MSLRLTTMPTSNEEILDALTRHQVGLMRLSGSMRNDMHALITSVEAEMRQEMLRRLSSIAVGDAALSPANTRRIAALATALDEIQAPMWLELSATLRSELLELSVMEAPLAQAIVEGALPVQFATVLPSASVLRRIVTQDPMDGRPIRDWVRQMRAGDRSRINQAIRIGLARGEDSRRIAARVFGTSDVNGANGARGITRRGATALTRTAVNHVGNQARQAFYLANRRLIPRELYVATLDARTTPICQGFDGETFPVGVGPTPPLHMSCRSIRVPVIDGNVLGFRPAVSASRSELAGLNRRRRAARVRALTGQVPATTNYNTFLRNQTAAFQDDVLGPTRGRLFRQGDLNVDRFTDTAGRELTLAQLRQRESAAFAAAGL